MKILSLKIYGFQNPAPTINVDHIRAILQHENDDKTGTIEIILDTGIRLTSNKLKAQQLMAYSVQLHNFWEGNL